MFHEELCNPLDDGVTHINIYSKGATQLGKLLTNFAHTPFVHPTFGRFESVEGGWHWLLTGCRHEHLKLLYGITAKKEADLYIYDKVNKDRGLNRLEQHVIESMIYEKIEQTPNLKQLLMESTLPFTHYYYFGDKNNPKIVNKDEYHWMVVYHTMLRDYYNKIDGRKNG